MRIFYVDYENVQSLGLEGIEQLVASDKVYIFYSVHAETMKISVVRQILGCSAEVEFVEADTGTENALDFQLVASLFMNVDDANEYYIISRDTGFDAAIKMGARSGYCNIKRISKLIELLQPELVVANTVPAEPELRFFMEQDFMAGSMLEEEPGFIQLSESKKQKLIDDIIIEKCGKRTCEEYGELIVTGLKTSGNKNQFYQFFRRNLGDAEGGELYRSIRSKFDEMKTLI
jgi:hypothetical protein